MNKIIYSIQKKLFSFIGDIKWSGFKRPFWLTINAIGYQIKGEHYRELTQLLKPGDVLIRRFEGYIDKIFIPGWWNHMGIYIGDDKQKKEQIVHAVSEGVIQEDILNFLRTDHVAILRIKKNHENLSKNAVEKAKQIVGKPYDFNFDFANCDSFSCTELANYCYNNIISGSKRLGKKIIVADDFYYSSKFESVWDSVSIEHKPVIEAFLATRCPIK